MAKRNLGTERKEGQDDADTVPAVGGANHVIHAAEDLFWATPVLAGIPGS